MPEFVVNLVLIAAVLMLLAAWALSAARNRRRDRREHAAERRLILEAVTHAAAPTVAADPRENVQPTSVCGNSSEPDPTAARERLDTASVAALLELLEDRRPTARGVLASLFSSPRTVWSAGTRAGQTLGQRATANQRDDRARSDLDGDLYRDAAAELITIHAHDQSEAQREYRHYASAVGDHALAELYVRSAASAAVSPDQVPQIVNDITDATKRQPRPAHSSQPTR